MDKYVKALQEGGVKLPPLLLRENVEQMKNIERLFEGKVRQLQVAIAKRDVTKLEEAIAAIEDVVANAKELLEKVKTDETDS